MLGRCASCDVGSDDAFDVDVGPVAHRRGDGLGLGDRAARAFDQRRLLMRRAHGRLRQHAHRTGAEVEHQLLPDQLADVRRDGDRQVGRAKRCRERLDARGGTAVRLAEHGAAAGAGEQADHARRGGRARRPEHAADGALGTDRAPQCIIAIKAWQATPLVRAAMRMEIPPRNAVHRERNRGFGAEQRPDGGTDAGQARAPSPRRSPHPVRRDRPGCRWPAAARRCRHQGFPPAAHSRGWQQGVRRAPPPTRRHRPWQGRPPDSRRPSRRRKHRSASLFGGYEMCGAPSPALPRFAERECRRNQTPLPRSGGGLGRGYYLPWSLRLLRVMPHEPCSQAPSAPPPASPRSPPSSPRASAPNTASGVISDSSIGTSISAPSKLAVPNPVTVHPQNIRRVMRRRRQVRPHPLREQVRRDRGQRIAAMPARFARFLRPDDPWHQPARDLPQIEARDQQSPLRARSRAPYPAPPGYSRRARSPRSAARCRAAAGTRTCRAAPRGTSPDPARCRPARCRRNPRRHTPAPAPPESACPRAVARSAISSAIRSADR